MGLPGIEPGSDGSKPPMLTINTTGPLCIGNAYHLNTLPIYIYTVMKVMQVITVMGIVRIELTLPVLETGGLPLPYIFPFSVASRI